MLWIEALKIYNARHGKWCVPKKGTAEHAEVKAIMAGSKVESKTTPAVKPKIKAKDMKEVNMDILGQATAKKSKERVAKFLLALAKKRKREKIFTASQEDLQKAIYSLGEILWKRFDTLKYKIKTKDDMMEVTIPKVDIQYSGYWDEIKPVLSEFIGFNYPMRGKVIVKAKPGGDIYVSISKDDNVEQAMSDIGHYLSNTNRKIERAFGAILVK